MFDKLNKNWTSANEETKGAKRNCFNNSNVFLIRKTRTTSVVELTTKNGDEKFYSGQRWAVV